MLRKIIINNFQSHKNTVIELDNVTVVHGLSDSGKSAIRKAIQCVVHKAPFYIRNGEDVKDGSIRLEFDDYIIERQVKVKNKKQPSDKLELSKDVYIVNDKDTYERFGIELPENIQKELRFFLQKFDSKPVDYNIMSQFDDMFFIGKSYDSIRNKMINMLVPDCDIIGKTIQDFKEKKNSAVSSSRLYKKLLEESTAKLEQIPADVIETCSDNIMKLERYSKSIEDKRTTLGELKITKQLLSNLELRNVDVEKYGTYIDSLNKGFNTLTNVRNKLYALQGIKHKLSHIELIHADFSECNTNELRKQYEQLRKMKLDLVVLTDTSETIHECKERAVKLDDEIAVTAKEIEVKKEEYIKTSKVVICPITNEKCEKLSK